MKHKIALGVALIFCLGAGQASAKGRSPDEESDKFPDYNKLDLHPKTVDQVPAPAIALPASPEIAMPAMRSTTTASDDYSSPKPPPFIAPPHSPKDESEPAMPDEINNTLEKSAPQKNK